ncbi:MAG TPA: hypothetical protein VFE46_18560 [Pirellulales bacterium]|jgi:hypothetical protein|nr:hypothetical protein [Pirellulales bacterium]
MDCRNLILRSLWAAMAGLMLCTGCIYFRGPKPPPVATPDANKATTSADAAAGANANGSLATPAELAAIMAEVQQLGTLDPAAQNALLEDLKKTDPSLWPQLVQTFRASIAYRKQAEERARIAAQQTGTVQPAAFNDGHQTDGTGPLKLPEADDSTLSPKAAPAELASNYPDTHLPAVHVGSATNDDWHAQLAAAIQALEAHTTNSGGANTSLSAVDEATLRMLYLVAGRRDDALKPVAGTGDTNQEFWSEELFGLAAVLDEQHMPDAQRRAAEAAQHLREAASKLGQSGTLVARNLTFCTEVSSYGIYKPFPKYEFKPGQEVVLYAEVENFSSDNSDKGYHTALKSSYQIVDNRGARVAEQEYATTEEWCKNPRRDFFVRYFLYMPKRIYDGNYTLQLTVEDTLGNKMAQSSIPFSIVGAD